MPILLRWSRPDIRDEMFEGLPSEIAMKKLHIISAGGMACKPYTTVSSYRNSFGLISYTACYLLGGLSAGL